jgi:hypothetical protein
VVVRDAEAGDVALVVGVVRDHGDDVGLELVAAPAPAPEQVEQAVVLARREHRRALCLVRVGEAPVHLERLRHLCGEGAFELVPPLEQPLEPEHHPHEERAALGVGRVLVGAEDVGVALGENPATVATIP